MRLFLSTYVNKVDRKGRVSVPAPFRAVLAGQNAPGIVAYRSFLYPSLDCSDASWLEQMATQLQSLPQYSPEYESLSTVFADTKDLPFDTEGRIMLPETMLSFAGITDTAIFVGLAKTFQIWEPARYAAHQHTMRTEAREKGMVLPPVRGGMH